jgi:hypothetical protein
MRKHTFGEFTRITKAQARVLWGKGETIAICPAELRPGAPWHPEATYTAEQQRDNDLDRVVNSFEYYNCQNSETGKYAAFYLTAKKLNPLAEKLNKI